MKGILVRQTVPNGQRVAELLELASEVNAPKGSELRRTAFLCLVDNLLISKQDSVLDQAIRSAPSDRIARVLHSTIEHAIEHVPVASAGSEITSNLFCAAVIIRLSEPVTSTEFDDLLKCSPMIEALHLPERNRAPRSLFAVPKLLAYEDMTSMSYSAQRARAASITEQYLRSIPEIQWGAPQRGGPHRRTRVFLRYVIGSRLTIGEQKTTGSGYQLLIKPLAKMLRQLSDAIESTHCECDGSWFAMMHKGHWLYQVARLEEVTHWVKEELRGSRTLAATVSTHGPRHSHIAQIGFFNHDALIEHRCYSMKTIPYTVPTTSVQEICSTISKNGIADVTGFPDVNHAVPAGSWAALRNRRGNRVFSQMLIPL